MVQGALGVVEIHLCEQKIGIAYANDISLLELDFLLDLPVVYSHAITTIPINPDCTSRRRDLGVSALISVLA